LLGFLPINISYKHCAQIHKPVPDVRNTQQ
jgi:hypothetical protein